MEILACVLIIFVHMYSANGVRLEKPMSLLALSDDLRSLEISSPSGLLMEDAVIKYDDKLRFVVKQHSNAAEKTFLSVDGAVTLAKLKLTSEAGENFHSYRKLRALFFRRGYFYFEDTTSEPEVNTGDYVIVDYQPSKNQIYAKPVLEYIPKIQFEIDLVNSISKMKHENQLTGFPVIKTYVRIANGTKIYATYDLVAKMVVFKGNFHVITTDSKNLYKMSVNLKVMRFDLLKKSFSEYSILGEVFAVRVQVTSPPTEETVRDVYLKITRNGLLKDAQESRPVRSSSIIGMIKYDRYRKFTVDYTKVNEKLVLRITGRFVTQDGDDLCCICIASPGEQWSNRSVILSDKTVLFSCRPSTSRDTQILLQEDTDYVATKSGFTILSSDSKSISRDTKKPSLVEPYLEYLPQSKLLRALEVVSDAMKIKCARGYHRKSFRLFLNVFLVYDCNTGIVLFDSLDLWISPGQQSSFTGEFPFVSYDHSIKRFMLQGEILPDFKLRQLHPKFPEKVPREMKYMYDVNFDKTNITVDFRSLEWDLSNIRKSLFQSVLPQAFGIVRIDNDGLIRAEKSQAIADGEKRLMVVVKGLYRHSLDNHCKGEYQLVYDGWKMIGKDSNGSESENFDKIYLPKTFKLSMLEYVSVTHQERYVTLTSFRYDMQSMTFRLLEYCEKLRGTQEYDEKLTIYVYYFGSMDPMIGYFSCELKYVSFFSDFKVIKYHSVSERSRSYQPGEELMFTLDNPEESLNGRNSRELIYGSEDAFDAEEEGLRRKYSDYIIRDLIYDQEERTFHSKSLFLAEVYALRLLPSYNKEARIRTCGHKFRLKQHNVKVVVYGQNAPKSAWTC